MRYPIAIEKGSEQTAFGVVVPDLPGCYSAGDSFDEALGNAKEAIEMHLEALAEAGLLPPPASSIDRHLDDPEFNGWVWALTEIDIEPFMGKSAKVNVTLPNLLTRKIDEVVSNSDRYKSRSHFLQVAATREFEQLTS